MGKGQGIAHPTPYGKARLAATILYDIPGYAVRSFFYKKLGIHPSQLSKISLDIMIDV
ncbi:MAG: hypothetical protein HUU08_09650 [Candidatus Brocadia sp.]|nr:hypothetical protein [Candidatus Brocadia sp.]